MMLSCINLSIARRGGAGSGAPITPPSVTPIDPATFFADGEDGIVVDPANAGTRFTNSAATTPASVDDPCGAIVDAVNGVRKFEQSTSARRPLIKSDGTYTWLEPDGSDDFMGIANSYIDFKFMHDGTGCTVLAGVQFGTSANPDDLFVLLDSSNTTVNETGAYHYYDNRSSNPREHFFGHAVTKGSGLTFTPRTGGANNVATALRDVVVGSILQTEAGNDAGLIADGKVLYHGKRTGFATGNSNDNLTLFRSSGSSKFHMEGRLYYLMIINRVLTDAELAGANAFIKSKMPESANQTKLHSFDAGSRTEWFVDQSNIESASGILYDVNSPVKNANNPLSEPIGTNVATWDSDKYFASVVLNDGIYRAWQGAYTDGAVRTGMTYSTSSDGVTWTKPNLGQVTYDGDTDNNIVLDGGYDHTVLWNGSEFVIQAGASDESGGSIDSNHAIYTSADGFTSLTLQKQLTAAYYEEFHGLSQRSDGRYLAFYTKDHSSDMRKIGAFLSASSDLTGSWVDQGTLIEGATDASQIYNFTAVTFHDVMYGVAVRFDDISERMWMDLFTSPADDGLTWTARKGMWLPHGKYGEYDGGFANGKQITNDGTTLKLFYGGTQESHGLAGLRDSRLCSADLATGRLGIVKGDGGHLITTAFTATENLTINAVSAGGLLKVELLDASDDSVLTGYSKDDCDNLDGDHMAKETTWGGNQIRKDIPVKLKIYLDSGAD